VTFLRCVGKGNELLQPLLLNNDSESLNPGQKYILENFEVKGNYEKLPNEISSDSQGRKSGKKKRSLGNGPKNVNVILTFYLLNFSSF
jgi:hypothetical protein